ncbi:agmatinase, mitochondrial isoform X2 [Vidua chalybeata]|uniref:agmatinase, mitochondrial isoform X2 n=1 Tax=Vidua chalybeata TaxID=81927 RepID=UPI0023A7B3F7|nr:agmatinase, mitochondrial isoform X2 [Vidua chalybeata]
MLLLCGGSLSPLSAMNIIPVPSLSLPGVCGGTGRGVCRCPAGYRHIQPAGSQVWPTSDPCRVGDGEEVQRQHRGGAVRLPAGGRHRGREREPLQPARQLPPHPGVLPGDRGLQLCATHLGHGPVGLVHVDAHTDTGDTALGEKIYHGSPFRRCVEERLLDCGRVVQIGIRGSSYDPDPHKYCWEQGFRVVPAEECWMKSLEPLMREVRAQMGDKPMYISFDIDGLDPAYAPGTGTPEIAGLTPAQALEIIRGCKGLNIVGCDLVEVAPMYDVSGNTALLGANLLFEMLCVLPGVKTL